MWLTSWWVAWLLNFYGFSHTNCMVFYRTPWTRYGIPWNCIGTSGDPMAFHGILQYSLEFHGPPRKLHGISWHSMELHGCSMDFHQFPWNSMDFHGFLWNSMEVFHTGKQLLDSGLELPAIINVLATCLFRTSPKSHPIQCKCLIIILLLTVYDQNSVLLCFLYKRI